MSLCTTSEVVYSHDSLTQQTAFLIKFLKKELQVMLIKKNFLGEQRKAMDLLKKGNQQPMRAQKQVFNLIK